jgi:hypothetical protein
LQAGSPLKLELLKVINVQTADNPNGMDLSTTSRYVEEFLHDCFEIERLHGEWFKYSERIEKLVGLFKELLIVDCDETACSAVCSSIPNQYRVGIFKDGAGREKKNNVRSRGCSVVLESSEFCESCCHRRK